MIVFRLLPCAAALLAFATASWASLTIAKRGEPAARIYVSPEEPLPPAIVQRGHKAPTQPLRIAQEELSHYLERISGAKLEVVPIPSLKEAKAPGIVLGKLAREAGVTLPETRFKDTSRLYSKDGLLFVTGENDLATLNATYLLLERLGCDWVLPGKVGEVVPTDPDLKIEDLDLTETPAFVGRNLWYRGGRTINTEQDAEEFNLWKQRQRMSPNPLTPELGAGHVWDSMVKRYKERFEQDPTLLALVRDANGDLVRKGPQIESTHPGIVDLFVEDIKATFAKQKWPKDYPAAFGIGPADGLGYSLSTESAQASAGRVDPIVGEPDVTDLLILLGNQILERLGEEYPNLTLGFYSYSTHADYPMRYAPNPRINQIFAPINFSRFHSVFDENSKTRAYYKGVVEQWGKQSRSHGNLLAYRGYNWNLAENMLPYSQLRILGEEIPWYRKNQISVVNIEATKAWSVNGPHDYLLAKLLWNADLDWKKVLGDYCRKAFGAGAPPMEQYFLELTERQHAAGQEAGSYHAFHLMYDLDFVAHSKRLVHQAIAEAKGADEKIRASHFLHPLDQLEAYLKFHQATTRFDFQEAHRLYQLMHEQWQKVYDENTNLVAVEVPQYLKRYLEQFVVLGQACSSQPNQMVHPLPDELKTMLDPNNVGEQLRFQSPALNDSLFMTTRTWSAPWDAQGLAAYRSGAVWYRIPFEVPSSLEGKPLGLFLGGVEDEAFVWINGTYLGKSGRGFSLPFTFDLTEAAKPGMRNLLAIKVVRNSAANEIGLGGILRPSFIFTGMERVKPRADREPKRRVLPGGELGEIEE